MALFQIANQITKGDSMQNLMSIQVRFMGSGDYFSEAFIGAFFACFSFGIIAAAILAPFISFYATFEHTLYRYINHKPHKNADQTNPLYLDDPRLDFDLVEYFKSVFATATSGRSSAFTGSEPLEDVDADSKPTPSEIVDTSESQTGEEESIEEVDLEEVGVSSSESEPKDEDAVAEASDADDEK